VVLPAVVRPRVFTLAVALARLAALGDLFAPVLEEPRPLGPAAKLLARYPEVR
jgi:hypothetical protein